jgi:hypothetical protein
LPGNSELAEYDPAFPLVRVAEDRGFEPLRAINPTRLPSRRERVRRCRRVDRQAWPGPDGLRLKPRRTVATETRTETTNLHPVACLRRASGRVTKRGRRVAKRLLQRLLAWSRWTVAALCCCSSSPSCDAGRTPQASRVTCGAWLNLASFAWLGQASATAASATGQGRATDPIASKSSWIGSGAPPGVATASRDSQNRALPLSSSHDDESD